MQLKYTKRPFKKTLNRLIAHAILDHLNFWFLLLMVKSLILFFVNPVIIITILFLIGFFSVKLKTKENLFFGTYYIFNF